MLSYGVLSDTFAFSAIVRTAIGLECIELGRMLHAQIVIRGFHSHTFVATSLLNMYAKFRITEDSFKVFNTMAKHNEVSWNAIILGFTLSGMNLESFDHLLHMKNEGIRANTYTIISVLKAVGTALIDMYSKCGSWQEAKVVFHSNFVNFQSGCDVIVINICNAIANAYAKCGALEDVKRFFTGWRDGVMDNPGDCTLSVLGMGGSTGYFFIDEGRRL
ncbi:pentatricopeptide repeat-containing protein At3g09040, mitochondrial-like [Mangifera indica]|uniref:pentatricopeptide repeat-containing protein At3g09040, mitochondrial-like n=1 Tax=Mangifera indica TaxID=29780 RepID=UPI001CFA2FD0|nr:pentatricopeptide repeat-containing protein At3g09040, mitochondrial-like [Mangifera indica]